MSAGIVMGGGTFGFMSESISKPALFITAGGKFVLGDGCTNADAAQAIVDAANVLRAQHGGAAAAGTSDLKAVARWLDELKESHRFNVTRMGAAEVHQRVCWVEQALANLGAVDAGEETTNEGSCSIETEVGVLPCSLAVATEWDKREEYFAWLAPVLDELHRATAKFPTWPCDPLHAVAIVGEEFGELTQATLQAVYEPHKSGPDEVRAEATQTAAMALRFLLSLDRYTYAVGAQHEQVPGADENWPQSGDLVRGGAGETNLMVLTNRHASGWHALHCMGGYTFVCPPFQRPSVADMRTWLDAKRWRKGAALVADAKIDQQLGEATR